MSFKDQIAFVRQHIRRNRLRVFMTVLAATMGTAFLIVLASVGFGLQKTIKDDILSNQMVTQIEVYSEDMTDAKADAMKKIDHVEAVVHRKSLVPMAMGELEGHTGSMNTYFTDFGDEQASGFKLAEGRFPEKPGEVIVGSQFAAQLIDESVEVEEGEEPASYEGKVIGQTFAFSFEGENDETASKTWPFTIVGVKEAPGKDWAFDGYLYLDESFMEEMESAYIAASSDNEQEDMSFTNSSVNVYADDLANVKAITQTLKDDGYAVYSVSEEIEQIDVFFLALKAGLIFVGTIAILIASIGIFNTMTMAVTERTREIGVMKALGAGPKLIQRLFLMESAWIGLVGTVIAVVISYGVSFAANAILPIVVDAALGGETGDSFKVTFSVIPWQLVLIASAISLTVAMISGWRPARKATKTDVIGALRHEL
ncbi:MULTISPECIES: ABC transporter permease [Bhargavaea]|uniref:ABC transporter permease n=1 Tax=Bhargavaea changchunensis TaxID=2134037 RepID=A0ABW2NJH9_9BACL|nr:FtsX-like permease family protein [Bhargavaea sp. CC-171006]